MALDRDNAALTTALQGTTAIALWRNVLVTTVRSKAPDLTARQLAILLEVYLGPPPHTVRGLAAELDLAKPVITRALDRLSRLGLLRRKRDDADKRSVLVQRTVRGAVYLSDFAEAVRNASRSLEPEPAL